MRVSVLTAFKRRVGTYYSTKNISITDEILFRKFILLLRSFSYQRKTRYVRALLARRYEANTFDIMQHQSGSVLAMLPFDVTRQIPTHVTYLLENLLIFIYQALKADGVCDLIVAAMTFYKLQSQCNYFPLTSDLFQNIRDFIEQTFATFDTKMLNEQSMIEDLTMDSIFDRSKSFLELWPKLQKTDLWKKVHKTMMFMSASALYAERCSKKVDAKFVAKVEKDVYSNPAIFKMDLVHSTLDTLLVLTEKGYQIFVTGEPSYIFHSGKSYELWLERSTQVISNSRYLCNPAPHNIDIHTFQKELELLIEQGSDILKMSCDIPKLTISAIRSTMSRLSDVKAYFINSQSANATRRAPLTLVVEGKPGGGKTHFSDILHMHYAKVRNKDQSFDNRYVRSAKSKHWDGFKSYKWSLLMDDVASENPDIAIGIPEGINELLNVVNNAPFMPTMAALEDKGNCPFSGELAVITTNSPYMHLHHYFATPAAAARRMKYHIQIEPKQQYMTGDLLDSTKLPPSCVGSYPDWWHIKILKVVIKQTQTNRLEPYKNDFELQQVHHFTNIIDFVMWYNGVIQDHHIVQDQIESSTSNIMETKLCDGCFVPRSQCMCKYENQGLIQVVSVGLLKTILTIFFGVVIDILFANSVALCNYMLDVFMCYVNLFIYSVFKRQIQRGSDWFWENCNLRNLLKTTIASLSDFEFKSAIFLAGELVKDAIGCPQILVSLGVIILSCISAYCLYYGLKVTYAKQTHIESGERPTGSELENVWFNNKYEVDEFDIGRLTSSWKGLSDDQIEKQILRNTVNCSFYFEEDGARKRELSSALCLGGQLYVTTSHSIPSEHDVPVEVVSGPSDKLGSMTSIILRQNDILRIDRLAYFSIHKLPPRANITGLFMGESVKHFVGDATMLGRNRDGSIKKKSIKALRFGVVDTLEEGPLETMQGSAFPETIQGDCGSIYLYRTGRGPVIGSIHELGRGAKCASALINIDHLKKYVDIEKLCSSGKPQFKAESANKELVNLHAKSPIRFIAQGHAKVYGSFSGFRAHMKTNVRNTMLHPLMVRDGFSTDLEPPIMHGWKPVRANLLKLVSDTPPINKTLLQNSVEALFADWSNIDPEELALITIYDDLTITNGAPGVRFVDAINRKTSAGFPWNKSKKYFMETIEVPGYDNCKKFTPEILARAEGIISSYLRHERACPVFSGSLKDKAVPSAKNKEAKIRMFMGAPVDFTYVMRKYLLSFVRVMQRNKFLFESAPGIEAQSAEWDSLYHYLTKHGDDRCVFGDFKAFDTSMPPEFLLAAFDLIISFHKMAGCSDDHVTILQGIMYDVVYAYVDVKGDLVELIGKNPSGHALTVTINSIVNCLYMRYAYAMFNPIEPGFCYDFKSNVNLITYGDDNGMNVARGCDWFNHNSISQALATINVTYTMADKVSDSVPFINISDASFLKRAFRYEEETKTVLCPLEPDSIIGSLMIGEASKFVSDKNQLCSVICAANDEWFWHGKDVFDPWHDRLLKYINELELEAYMPCSLATWPELIERYQKNSDAYYSNSDIEKYYQQGLVEVLDCDEFKLFTTTSSIVIAVMLTILYIFVLNLDESEADFMTLVENAHARNQILLMLLHSYFTVSVTFLHNIIFYALWLVTTILLATSPQMYFSSIAVYVIWRYR